MLEDEGRLCALDASVGGSGGGGLTHGCKVDGATVTNLSLDKDQR